MIHIKIISFSVLIGFATYALSDSGKLLVDTLSEYQMEAAWPWSSIDDTLYLATTSGLLVANGQKNQHFYPGKNLFPVVTDERNLYLTSTSGELWQSSAHSPEKTNWHRHFRDWVFPPIVQHQQLYITTRFEGLQAINPATGKTIWSVSLKEEPVYRPIFLPDNQIGVFTYGSNLLIFTTQGILIDDIKLPTIGKYLKVYDDKIRPTRKMLHIVGIDGSLIQVEWSTRNIKQQKVSSRVLTPVYSDSDFWWLLEDRSQIWQLNLETGSLLKQEINQHHIEYIYPDNKNWISIIKNKGTFSKQWLSMKPAM